jgi:phage terminase large subunit-like protein
MLTDPTDFSDEELLAALSKIAEENKLLEWFDEKFPYRWQRAFFDAGEWAKQRCVIAANGVGKSFLTCAELAMHVTGRYPPWWKGARFDYGGWECWIGSIDNDMQKRGPQRALLGRELESVGTALIPKDSIKSIELRQAGVKSVVDTLVINHISGRPVTVKWLTFEQGWRKWQSGDPKIILWDEEPDESIVDQKDIMTETLTRLVRNNGIWIVGYTPLLGETNLTKHFMDANKDDGIFYVGATWDDAPHMDAEQRRIIESQYPAHQRDARTKGIPMLGTGRIFTVGDSDILIDPIHIPDHWARICGIDFGMAHPCAAAWVAWDRDTGYFYLYDCWKKESAKTYEHAQVINSRGKWIPVAWPHDGEKRDPKSGQRFADIYRGEHEVNMLSKSARYKNDTGGSQAQWPIIEEIRLLMESGKFKVFRTCTDWVTEFHSYHTKDGKIVSRRDDVLKASFYAKMMVRYAVSKKEGDRILRLEQRSAPAAFTTAVH